MSEPLVSTNLSENSPGYEQLAQLPLPQFVFNAAAINISASEVSAVVSFGARPLMMLIMAPSAAKSFAQSILNSIEDFERRTDTTILSMDEITARAAAYKGQS